MLRRQCQMAVFMGLLLGASSGCAPTRTFVSQDAPPLQTVSDEPIEQAPKPASKPAVQSAANPPSAWSKLVGVFSASDSSKSPKATPAKRIPLPRTDQPPMIEE